MTLIEQLLTALIAATLACIGLPALWRLMAVNETRIAQTELINTLNHARALAAQSGRTILACPSRDGEQCSGEAAWESGWLVGFRGDKQGEIAGTPEFRHARPTGPLNIFSTQGRRSVQFQPDGSAGGSNLTLLICRRQGDGQTLSVKVSNAGRVRGGKGTEAEARQCMGT